MSAPVEAQSLSNLTYLLANPPQYPRNPTHETHPPLTLYIVRVPGSKDVFLSPLKPPTKASISLEAIQSSLYYFHVETDEDEQVRRSFQQQRETSDPRPSPVTVARKPVATHPLVGREQPYDGTKSEILSNDLRVDTNLDPTVGTYSSTNDHTLPSKRARLNDLPMVQEPPKRDSRTRPITVIRRDPASSNQWNIGTITVLDSSFQGSTVRPVQVELSTPGYLRFDRSAYNTPASAGSNADLFRQVWEQASTQNPANMTTTNEPFLFKRVVDFRRMAISELKRTVYQRTNSSDSIGKADNKVLLEKSVLSFDSPWLGQCNFVNGIDGNSLKLRHTVKSTSSSADSQTANVAELRFNLGWSLLNNRTNIEPDKIPIPDLIKTKKENLRRSFQHIKEKSRGSFQKSKLQHGDPFQDLTNIQTPTSNNLEPATSGGGPSVPSSIGQTSSDNEDDNRISLKLGREKAGGGFRGHSAKLGKLIIEDEGLKMCDLVVAAAMGIWWQHYEH